MLSVQRTVVSTASPSAVFAYLADFTHAEQWDPGTQACTRIDGDGGVGTRYRNVSKFLGRTTELTYTTEELTPETFVHLIGRNEQFTGHDRLQIAPDGSGTRVTYDAQFEFHGLSKVAAPVVQLYLPRLADKTAAQLKQSLDSLS